MIAVPPFFDGTENGTEAVATEMLTVPIVGAVGTVAGWNVFDAADGGLVPCAFVAVTRHVYVYPFVSPVTTIGLDEPLVDRDTPPLVEVHDTVKLVIGLPPSEPGVNVTDADAFPRVAVPIVGAAGAVPTIKLLDTEPAPVPTLLVAVTVHV